MDAEFLLQHSLTAKQTRFIRAATIGKYRIVAALSGKGGGKSLSECIALGMLMIKNWRLADGAYIMAAPNYKTLSGGLSQSFDRVFKPLKLGAWQRQEKIYTALNGHRVYARSMDNENSLEGIQEVLAALLDEAGQYFRIGWLNAQARCAANAAPLLLGTTPYSINWLKGDVADPFDNDGVISVPNEDGTTTEHTARDYIQLYRWWSHERPGHKENFALQKKRMGEREFMRNFSPEFVPLHGLVYDDFQRNAHVLSSKDDWYEVFQEDYPRIPAHFTVTAGVDWGATEHDPFAVVVVAYGPDGRSFQVAESLRSKKHSGADLSGQDMLNVLIDLKRRWNISIFHCDNDKKMIEDLNRKGCPAAGTDKSAGVRYGIGQHKALIRTGMRYIFDTCEFTIDAYQTYHWREQTNPDKGPHQRPSHVMSDLMDATRYDTMGNLGRSRIVDVREPMAPFSNEEGGWDRFRQKAGDAGERIKMALGKAKQNLTSWMAG